MTLRTVDEHRAAVLAGVSATPVVALPVLDALGLRLAEPVVAAVDLPGFDNSAMDGYAVRAADLAGEHTASGVVLVVDGDIAAGDTREHALAPGRAMRIMTGAPMPAGADAVVPVEASDGGVDRVRLDLAPEVGRHVRRRGEDVRAGAEVLPAGSMLTPGRVALVTAANVPTVAVHRRPRVLVVSTGDELVPAGSVPAHGQIVDSNGPMLAALVRAAGAEVAAVLHLADDASAVRSVLVEPPGDPDLVLTTGGVSMGAYDTVKEVLTEVGGVEFTKVAMRPGMPQGTGRLGERGVPIVTLPGNPVSSLVSFHVFVLPLLRVLAGGEAGDDEGVVVPAAAAWGSAEGKLELTRVVVGPDGARPSGGQGSHMLGALAEGTHLAWVPAEVARVEPGMPLRVTPLLY